MITSFKPGDVVRISYDGRLFPVSSAIVEAIDPQTGKIYIQYWYGGYLYEATLDAKDLILLARETSEH